MSIFKKLFGEGDAKGKKQDRLPENDAFAVVTGNILTREGVSHLFTAIVPAVFGSDGDGDVIDPTVDELAWETAEFALQVAQEKYPSCRWRDENEVQMRKATDAETLWAIENNINQKFGL
jgi:hypothetical protein